MLFRSSWFGEARIGQKSFDEGMRKVRSLVSGVCEVVDGVAAGVVALDGGRAFGPATVLERTVTRGIIIDMSILPCLYAHGSSVCMCKTRGTRPRT